MDKKYAYRVYLRNSLLEKYLMSVTTTYFLLYLFSNITSSEKSIMNIIGCLLCAYTTSLLRNRRILNTIRRFYWYIGGCVILLESCMGVALIVNPFVAGIINVVIGSMCWTLLENIDCDLYNQLFKGKSRTLLDQTSRMYSRISVVLGSITILMVDTYIEVTCIGVAILSVASVIFLVIMDGINITVLEKALKKSK